jgi:multidrug resistance protein
MEKASASRDSEEMSPVDKITSDSEKGVQEVNDNAPRIPASALDWDGPDDPGNPQNWTTFKKAWHTGATATLGFAVTIGSSMITPATPEIARHFDVSRTAAILSLSLYVLGLALGPIIAAPISETFGRSVVYKVSASISMLFLLGAGFSKSFGSLLVCRLLAGTVGGPVLAVGAGTNADMYSARNRATASAFFVMMPFLGPALGPPIGGFAAQYKGWRWTQWCTIFIAIAAAVPIYLMFETYKKVLLQKRAKKLGIPGPPKPAATGWPYWKMMFTITLTRPAHMLATEAIVGLFSLYTAFTFSVLFAFFAAYPFTFESVYGFNTWQYGLTFLGIGAGNLLGVATAIAVDRLYYGRHHRRVTKEGKAQVPPEYRLLSAMIGSVLIPIG